MRRQVQQNIFANVRGEIDDLGPGQFMMNRKGFHCDIERKRLEATHAFQFDRLRKHPCHPQSAFRDAEVERITERAGADDTFRSEIGNRAFLLTLEMEAVGLNLAEMDFHWQMTKHE